MAALAKRELPSSASRGEDTRQRLIEAALKIFGESSFEGASTRMLADAAGANLAAIPYHFGSKEGLYRAAAEFVVENCGKEMLPTLDRINLAIHAKKLSRSDATELLHQLVERFSSIVIGSEFADRFAGFVLREQLQPGAAFEILYDGLMSKTMDACRKLLAIILARPADDKKTLVRAQTLLGQVLVFRTSRACVFRQLGWKEFSKDHLELIQSIVRDNIDRILASK